MLVDAGLKLWDKVLLCYLLWIRGGAAPRGLCSDPVVHSNLSFLYYKPLFPSGSAPFPSPWTSPLSVVRVQLFTPLQLRDGPNDLSKRSFPPPSSAPAASSPTTLVASYIKRNCFFICALLQKRKFKHCLYFTITSSDAYVTTQSYSLDFNASPTHALIGSFHGRGGATGSVLCFNWSLLLSIRR